MGKEKFRVLRPKSLAVLPILLLTAFAAAEEQSLDALMAAEHWKRVWALIEPRLKENPSDSEALFILARYQEAARNFESALALMGKALAINPQNADFHCLMAVIYGRQAISASIFRKLTLAHRIKREAERAIQLNPKHIEARLVLIEYYLQAPGIVGGSKAKARVLAEEVVELDPARGFIAQASIAHRERQTDKQEELYKKAVAANPQSYEALVSLARFYVFETRSHFDITEKYAREATRLDPSRIGAYSLLAQSLTRQERWAELDDVLNQAENNVPDNLYPYYQAGRIVYDQGQDLARAERYFRKFLTQEPEPTAASLAQAYWRLGLLLEKDNREAEAIEALKNAVKLDPGFENAKKDLKRLT